MNNDLISREALKEEIEELKKSPWYCEHRGTIDGIASRQAQKEALQIIGNIIDNAPTVTPQALYNGIVELISKNGITTINELLETLKGGDGHE